MDDEPTQRGHRGRGDAADSLEAAADHVRAGRRAAPTHDDGWHERQTRADAEIGRLPAWAGASGKLGGRLPPVDSRHGEHDVHFDARTNRYWKATRTDRGLGFGISLNSTGQGATAGEHLHRLVLNNRFFGDDVRLERVVKQGGKVVVVTTQPNVVGRPAVPGEIRAMMAAKGFEELAPAVFYHPAETVLVHDLAPRNVVFTQGLAVPIDPVLQWATPEFAEFIRRHWRHLPHVAANAPPG